MTEELTRCAHCGADPVWINDRYFSMLAERDRWWNRYDGCVDRLRRSRWITFLVAVVALLGWLR